MVKINNVFWQMNTLPFCDASKKKTEVEILISSTSVLKDASFTMLT